MYIRTPNRKYFENPFLGTNSQIILSPGSKRKHTHICNLNALDFTASLKPNEGKEATKTSFKVFIIRSKKPFKNTKKYFSSDIMVTSYPKQPF